eukprot:scaffold133456_cov106-Phaeocystis_antarctica.AAC.1
MDDPLADGAQGGSMAGGAERLARRSKENGSTVGAAVEGSCANGASPLAAAPNRFANQVAGAAQRAGTFSCSTTDWPLELDGGPGGSDVADPLRRYVDRLDGSQSWHGLARCGSWHGLARCDGSPSARAARTRLRPRPARPAQSKVAAIRERPVAPAILLCLPMWQWAKMVGVSVAAKTLRATAAAGLATATVERAVLKAAAEAAVAAVPAARRRVCLEGARAAVVRETAAAVLEAAATATAATAKRAAGAAGAAVRVAGGRQLQLGGMRYL